MPHCHSLSSATTHALPRRRFLSAVAGSLAALGSSPLSAAGERPNIVLIFADDLGYGDLSCYGHPTIRTPHLDHLAAEGARFTQFYSAAPVCTPSRAALLTGRLPIRSGLTHVLFPWSEGGIPEEEITLAEALKGAGYATACVGKWHLGHLPPYLPTRHGFDRYFGIPFSNDMSLSQSGAQPGSEIYQRYEKQGEIPIVRDDRVIERGPDQSQLTARYTAEAIRFIDEAAAKPFFLYLPHTFPHVPLYASDRFRGKSPRGLYGDVVEELDWSVGEILKALDRRRLRDKTLVIFTSDNGPWLLKREEGGSAGLLREGKASTWEGGMRVPFLARWPGKIPAGVVNHEFASTLDLFPTCLALAGAKLPPDRDYDGSDITPILAGRSPHREALLFFYNGTELRAVRKGPWKLHVATNDAAVGGDVIRHNPPLLFHLEADPSEKYNVAHLHPGVVQELLQLMEQHRASVTPGKPQR